MGDTVAVHSRVPLGRNSPAHLPAANRSQRTALEQVEAWLELPSLVLLTEPFSYWTILRAIVTASGTVVENEVLMLEHDNKPGTLSEIAKKLAKQNVNIEYAYLATAPTAEKGVLIFRPDNLKKAFEVLS